MSAELVAYRTRSGTLEARLGKRTFGLSALGPLRFAAAHEPNIMYLSFLDLSGNGSVDHAQVDVAAFERISFWQRPAIQRIVVMVLALLVTSFVLVWPVLAVRRRKRGTGASATPSGSLFGPRASAMLLFLACLLQLGSAAGVYYWASEPQSSMLAFGFPPSLQLCRWVAFGIMLSSPLLLVLVGFAWKGKYWSLYSRTYFTTVALGLVASCALAAHVGVMPV